MIARFASIKRQDTIVEAISKLSNSFHAVLVGGDGGRMNSVKVLSQQLGVEDRVHFLGIRSDVPQILKSSDVVIMASDYEGLSLSSIEGMASGKPFVATNVNGLREVVEGAGVLFENKDADGLANVLNELYTNREYYCQISKKCQRRAEQFDVKKCAQGYLEVYRKFCK